MIITYWLYYFNFVLGLDYRLDYILRESNLGVSYLSALTSHTAYWTNYDVAYFILTQIFPEFENNDPSLYPEKGYSEKFNPYSQSYSQESQYKYENQNYSQFDSSKFKSSDHGNFPLQNMEASRQPMQPPPQNMYNKTSHQPFQASNYQSVQDYNKPYPNQSSQGYPHTEQHNYLAHPGSQHPGPQYPGPQNPGLQHPGPQHPGPQHPGPQHPGPQHPGPQHPGLQHSGPQHHGLHNQGTQNPSMPHSGPQQQYQQSSGYQQQSYSSYSAPQQQQQQPLMEQLQQPNYQASSSYTQNVEQHNTPVQPHNYQQPNQPHQPVQNFSQPTNRTQDQGVFQNYQPMQPTQSSQSGQMMSTQQKNPQPKTGFFEKFTDEKKPVGAASPTKSTKSFFPSFNLSSLTSPVKNLSNSLSNISNQMTNIGSGKDSVGSNSGNIQSRSPVSLLGNSSQNKNMSPNYSQQSRPQSSQVQCNQGQYGQYQQVSPNQMLSQNLQQNIRSSSPYEGQAPPMGIRSGSPVSLQNRCSPMQCGPIETPVGAIKPKTIRLQPKVPTFEQKIHYGHEPTSLSNKTRCVSPLGQSRVVCSGSRSSLSGSYGLPLGGRSLSSGNLRNSTLVSGTYPGSRSNYSYLGHSNYLSHSGLDRRTMSRPNLSTTGSSYTGSALGMSSLVYNSPFGGTRTYLNREYSGSSSR